jgi:hypothetical protein
VFFGVPTTAACPENIPGRPIRPRVASLILVLHIGPCGCGRIVSCRRRRALLVYLRS